MNELEIRFIVSWRLAL